MCSHLTDENERFLEGSAAEERLFGVQTKPVEYSGEDNHIGDSDEDERPELDLRPSAVTHGHNKHVHTLISLHTKKQYQKLGHMPNKGASQKHTFSLQSSTHHASGGEHYRQAEGRHHQSSGNEPGEVSATV